MTPTTSPITLDRLLYDRKSAARLLSMSVRKIDYLIADGRIKTQRIDSSVRIPAAELLRLSGSKAADHERNCVPGRREP